MLNRQIRGRRSHQTVALITGTLLWGMVVYPARAQSEVGVPSSLRMIASEPANSGAADYRTIYVSSEIERESAEGSERQPLQTVTRAVAALHSGLALVTGENPDLPISRPANRRSRPGSSSQLATVPPLPSTNTPINKSRLAVPNSSIPLGSGGATIFSPPRGGAGASPAPPSRAQALGLYYRVLVEISDPYVQDDVKRVVPDAFRANFEGRMMMQVGAFLTEEEAEVRKRLLEDNFFDARVEYIR